MDNNMIDYENFTVDELRSYEDLLRKVQLPISDFEDMADFPPMCLSVNREKRNSFMMYYAKTEKYIKNYTQTLK